MASPMIKNDVDKKKIVINSLNNDVLAEIFMWLPVAERINMEKVCVKWKEACYSSWYDVKKYKCELSIGRSNDNHLLTQSHFKEILLRCGKYLKELSLSGDFTSSLMPFIGRHCKNLTTFECNINIILKNYNANDFVQAFTNLNRLKCIRIITNNDKHHTRPCDIFRIMNSLPEEIDEIYLAFETPIRDKQTNSIILKKFNNLKKLTLYPCGNLESLNLQEIAESTTLVHLNIQLYEIPREFFLFDKLVNLEYLDLTLDLHPRIFCAQENNLTTDVLRVIFRTCKKLKHLDLPPGRYNIAEIPRYEWINLQNLEYLGFSCNLMLDLANTIVTYCKDLKHLKIPHYSDRIKSSALKSITKLEKLESLILFSCIKVKKRIIKAISKNCKKLKRLEIPNISITVSSIDVEPLFLDRLATLQNLEHLNLRNVINLRDRTIIAIANNCKNLKALEIGYCTNVTSTGLCALTKLENLQKLGVARLGITDRLISELKVSKELNCSHCQELTNAGIIQFIKNNPDLENIDLSNIRNIKSDLVIAAGEATKNRTNGITLHISVGRWLLRSFSPTSSRQSRWLNVRYL